MTTENGGQDEAEYEVALRAELDRRLGVLAKDGDQAFGHMGLSDTFLITVVCLIVPAVVLWWFR